MDYSKLAKFFAQTCSYLFHPLLMTTFAAVIFFNSGHFFCIANPDIKNTIYFIFFILTFLSPALFIPIIYYFKLSSKREFSKKNAKLFILLIVTLLYSVVYYYMQRINMPLILLNVILSSILLSSLCFIITIFWNISVYSSSIGGLLGYVFYLVIELRLPIMIICFITIFIAGLILSSRLYLNKHNALQVYLGLILGLISVYFCMLIF